MKKKKVKIYKTAEVTVLCECDNSTAQKWAKANNVNFIGVGRRKDYEWTESDIKRFKERPRPGRRWD
jgi:hypothetical protein